MAEEPKQPLENGVIPKGTLVTISGLESEAWKKLNGSHGIVLNEPEFNNGAWRYPVIVYVSNRNKKEDWELLNNPKKKNIKANNLEAIESPQSSSRTMEMLKVAAVLNSGDPESQAFWRGAYYKVQPDDLKMGAKYAMALLSSGDPQAALEVCLHLLSVFGEDDKAAYRDLCCMTSVVYGKIGGADNLKKSYDFFMKCPTDTEKGKKAAMQALSHLNHACDQAIYEDPNFESGEVSEIHIKVGHEKVQRAEEDERALVMADLGAAYCMSYRHLEGARWYRKSLDSGKLDPQSIQRISRSLIVAQLQCPGQPLEDKLVLAGNGNLIRMVNKSDRDKFRLHHNDGKAVGHLETVDNTLQLETYQIPDDIDDPKHFPLSLLQQVSV